jgi:hypothetical protein
VHHGSVPNLRSTRAILLTVALFVGGLFVGLGCGAKSGGGMTHPATLVYAKSGKTLTTVTGP